MINEETNSRVDITHRNQENCSSLIETKSSHKETSDFRRKNKKKDIVLLIDTVKDATT